MTPYDYAAEHFQRFCDELIDLLRLPSVSTDPDQKHAVLETADWLAAHMQHIGLENVRVMPTAGYPVVYADWLHAGDSAPTVLIYGHYDVQPAVLEDGWLHDPFTPEIRANRLYARGSADDKGQVMIHLKAVESLLAHGGCPVNVKYIIEGEEEIGSPNLAAFVTKHKDLLKADICVISDTGIHSLEQPLIYYSLRGLLSFELIVSGPTRDLHSGYGGMLHNPNQAIAEMVAQLHHADGKVAVPGFYDDVLLLSDEERAELAKANMPASEWQKMMGDLPEWGEPGYIRIEKYGARPTLEINGIYGGYVGEGFKTVIPAKAIAKISCRLVANQKPEKIWEHIQHFIQTITPPTVRSEVRYLGGGEPAYTPIDHPAVQAAVRAYNSQWENPVLFGRGGGSIPIVADFQVLLGVPVVLMGFSLPDAGAHGPNESFHLEMYRKGINTVIAYLHEVKHARL
jgi:acetylornithine deacetylase/succinyl-diaminopimelate desuccinylase-like protein